MKKIVIFLVAYAAGGLWVLAARWTLVDFGSSAATRTAPYPGWTTVLRHPTRTQFVDPDGHSAHAGITDVAGLDESQWSYFGIQGSAPIDFRRGHVIICTLYNRNDFSLFPAVRISFADANEPNPADASQPWYTAYHPDININTAWVEPHSLFEMRYYIQDETMLAAIGGIASTGRHSLINVNLAAPAPGGLPLVLTKIELSDEADLTPPSKPANLRARLTGLTAGLSNNVVELLWDAAADPGANATGISRYYVYRNGELYDFVSREMTAHLGAHLRYLDLCVAPGSTYVYRVAAIDKAQYGLYPRLGRAPGHPANQSPLSEAATATVPEWNSATLLNPWTDFAYAGGFRLPQTPAEDWSWASSGLAWRPDGNPEANPATELPGSLYALSHSQAGIGAVTIPKPMRSPNLAAWPRARTLIPVRDIWPRVYGGRPYPSGGADWPVASLAYHPGGNGVGARLYYGICNFYGTDAAAPTHGWFDLGLAAGHGAWYIGGLPPANVAPSLTARYACPIPSAWANRHAGGRSLLIGNNFLSGGPEIRNGPNVYAIAPWASGSLPANGAALPATLLLQYSPIGEITRQVPNWRIDRNAEGAAWIEWGGQSALAISYRRPLGDGWYGDRSGNNFTYFNIPLPPSEGEGAGATRWRNELMLYNPADLAAVAAGTKEPWEPLPYATYDLAQFSFATNRADPESGAICFATNGYLFYLEHNGDELGEAAVNGLVHVWRVETPAVLTIAPSTRTHSAAEANGQTMGVAANVPWTTAVHSAWIAITSGSSGSSNGTVTYSVAANAGAIRSGTITVTGGGISRTFTVNQWPVPATPGVSTEGDVDGDGAADFSVYHPATGNWHVLFSAGVGWTLPWGWAAAVPVPADYNGDGMLDFAVYHPATGNWHIQESATGRPRQMQFGWSATVPLPGDYDGDGKADLAVFHQAAGRWYFLCTTAGRYNVQWGWSTTIPVPADYDGDGATDVAVYHPPSGLWQILKSSTGGAIQKQSGWSTALPVPADYDGDGKADIAVFHRETGTWRISYSGGGSRTKQFGWASTIPVAADYDGDGAADLAVYHPATGSWHVLKSTTGGIRTQNWGWSAAKPTLLYSLIHSWFHMP